ncbi:MAG: TIGR03936 family radical SAM-associated protein [Chloroflexi bacterium]|nr:TIGR03936 family radical SAM-associated protein [Chloroflexota bacterium]
MHRLRVKFGRGDQLKYLSHLDLMRLWERALRRADITPAYSEGFTPHPRISLAAPLPVGITSNAELMDIFFNRRISPGEFLDQIGPQLPGDIEVIEVITVAVNAPSLQSSVRFAEYTAEMENNRDVEAVASSIAALLAAAQFPWHHTRDTGERYYDLRTLIDDLWLMDVQAGSCIIGMRLRCDPSGSGRPEQVIKALGFSETPGRIHRTKLILA